ncbi:hypothetical protein M5K25_010816 [Dendrobium thyrsiflorum]|uniref:Uncharacterized protein n=1 Tax=Dendrobium thyrsiflorum TaxID=117978 RepID=A0ABD0V129_DENTH
MQNQISGNRSHRFRDLAEEACEQEKVTFAAGSSRRSLRSDKEGMSWKECSRPAMERRRTVVAEPKKRAAECKLPSLRASSRRSSRSKMSKERRRRRRSRTAKERPKKRKGGGKSPSQLAAPVAASDRKCRDFRPTGRGSRRIERSRTATEERKNTRGRENS